MAGHHVIHHHDHPCPWCGCADPTGHLGTCPTLGTCAQFWPDGFATNLATDLSKAHPEAEWLAGRPFTVELFAAHMREAHPETAASPPSP